MELWVFFIFLIFLGSISWFIKANGDPPLESAEEQSLWESAKNGDLDALKKQIDHGADIHAKDNDGQTALHLAATYDQLEVVKYLVEQGADVNAKLSDGETALRSAASGGPIEMVKYLVEQGADIHAKDEYGQTALHSAAYHGPMEVVKYLMAQGADINAKDNDGKTALHNAASSGDMEVVKYLVEQGADIHAKDNDGQTASALTDIPEIKAYLNNPPQIKAVNTTQTAADTELHEMVKAGNLEVVKYLLSKGANCNIRDAEGKLLLQLARESTHEKRNSIIVALIKAGAEE